MTGNGCLLESHWWRWGWTRWPLWPERYGNSIEYCHNRDIHVHVQDEYLLWTHLQSIYQRGLQADLTLCQKEILFWFKHQNVCLCCPYPETERLPIISYLIDLFNLSWPCTLIILCTYTGAIVPTGLNLTKSRTSFLCMVRNRLQWIIQVQMQIKLPFLKWTDKPELHSSL